MRGGMPACVDHLGGPGPGRGRRAATVVEALVTSAPTAPVSQYASRSGISSMVAAAESMGVGGELVDRVERQVLDPGDRVELGRGHRRRHRPAPRRCGRPGSAPGCRAARPTRRAARSPRPRSRCPALASGNRRAAAARPCQHRRRTAAGCPSTACRPRAPARSGTGAPRAATRPSRADLRRPSPGRRTRPGRRAATRDRLGHRRNAAATPASTGMSRPVVSGRSPAHSANTAAATCSGRTSRLSSVRRA